MKMHNTMQTVNSVEPRNVVDSLDLFLGQRKAESKWTKVLNYRRKGKQANVKETCHGPVVSARKTVSTSSF